jgi:hypothetical protein
MVHGNMVAMHHFQQEQGGAVYYHRIWLEGVLLIDNLSNFREWQALRASIWAKHHKR